MKDREYEWKQTRNLRDSELCKIYKLAKSLGGSELVDWDDGNKSINNNDLHLAILLNYLDQWYSRDKLDSNDEKAIALILYTNAIAPGSIWTNGLTPKDKVCGHLIVKQWLTVKYVKPVLFEGLMI